MSDTPTRQAWTAVKEAFDGLRATWVPFSERNQRFFCLVCRYRDPLGPDGNKLHDPNCPLLNLHDRLDELDALLTKEADRG